MSAETALKLLAGPHHYRTVILSLDEAAALLALLDEALGLLRECEAGWDAIDFGYYAENLNRTDVAMAAARAFLARFPAPSPTDEETT